jgi:hypothetical protein
VTSQLFLLPDVSLSPAGLQHRPDFVSERDEHVLVQRIRSLPLQSFQFGAFLGTRVAWFGWRYDYSQQKLQQAEALRGIATFTRAPAHSTSEARGEIVHDDIVVFEAMPIPPTAPGGKPTDAGLSRALPGRNRAAQRLRKRRTMHAARRVTRVATDHRVSWPPCDDL